MAVVKNTSLYGTLANHRAKRRAIVDEGMGRLNSINNAMRNNISSKTNMQVQIAEMGIRSKVQADMKARMSKVNELQNKFNKLA